MIFCSVLHAGHLKASSVLQTYRECQSSSPPNTPTYSNSKTTPNTTSTKFTLKDSFQYNTPSTPPTPTTQTKTLSTPEQVTPISSKISRSAVTSIDCENLPTQETPSTNVSALGNRKRKLVLSASKSSKKTRKSCSMCGSSLVTSKTSRTEHTCSKCVPSLHKYFKPQ